MAQPDTRERILDAAEELFAVQGYHGTSLRAITAAAAVNLAAVNYHFGSKEALLEEVLRRRMLPLNTLRDAALDAVVAKAAASGTRPDVGDIFRAFIAPTVRFCYGESRANHFSTLVGRSIAEPDATVRGIFLQLVQPLLERLMALLGAALPELSPAAIFWRLQCSIGATTHLMRLLGHGRGLMPHMPEQVDTEALIDELVTFVTAGTRRDA